MTAYYSVIRYVPNPVSDESINVGLISFAGDSSELTLTEDWSRARAFGRTSPAFLRAALDELRELHRVGNLTEAAIRKLADSWHHQIQLTVPRASTLEVDALHEQLSSELLRQPIGAEGHPGKRRVIRTAKDALQNEMRKRYGVSKTRAGTAIKSLYELDGDVKEHTLDLAVVNGHIQAAGLGLSLAQANKAQLEREIDGVAFAIGDVRHVFRNKPLAVLAYTHGIDPQVVRRARTIFGRLHTDLVVEREVPTWSRGVVEGLPGRMFGA